MTIYYFKIYKHPQAKEEYQRAIDSLDRQQLVHLYVAWQEIRTNYIVIYDIVVKNLERLVKPRPTNHSNMY